MLLVVSIITTLSVSPMLYADETQVPDKATHIVDGFYAAYPPTNPASGEQAEKIKRGEYLAKMGDCIACHSNMPGEASYGDGASPSTPPEGEAPYAGGLPIATPFGTFYSPNITPDRETGIGSWSEADFVRALK